MKFFLKCLTLVAERRFKTFSLFIRLLVHCMLACWYVVGRETNFRFHVDLFSHTHTCIYINSFVFDNMEFRIYCCGSERIASFFF